MHHNRKPIAPAPVSALDLVAARLTRLAKIERRGGKIIYTPMLYAFLKASEEGLAKRVEERA